MKTLRKRLTSKIKINDTTGCWEWQGSIKSFGYGGIGVNGKTMRAHRASWLLYNGPIPDGLCVLHKCDNRSCVNPDHLFLGTVLDNVIDMDNKGRCKRAALPVKVGEDSTNAKLTWERVKEIRSSDKTLRNLANEYGVDHKVIHRIKKNTLWFDPDFTPRPAPKRYRPKLTFEEAEEIRKIDGIIPRYKISKMYGVSKATIVAVVKNQTWKGRTNDEQ